MSRIEVETELRGWIEKERGNNIYVQQNEYLEINGSVAEESI
jgi:hypothetical protein